MKQQALTTGFPTPPHAGAVNPLATYATIPVIASTYSVSPRTVRRWMADGLIPYYRCSSQLVRFKVAEVEQALARVRIPARAEKGKAA